MCRIGTDFRFVALPAAMRTERVEAAQEIRLRVGVLVAALSERRPARRVAGGAAAGIVLETIERPHRRRREGGAASSAAPVAVRSIGRYRFLHREPARVD